MTKHIVSLCAAAVVVIAISAGTAFAADSPWNGTWKLNQDKSQFTGETFTVSTTPSGSMHFTNGATLSYDFACDGKDYPVLADRTVSCSKNSDGTFDSITKAKGAVLSKTHRSLSSDRKTLTSVTTGTSPDGTAYTDTNFFTRLTPGTAIASKWKNVKSISSSPDVIVVKISPPDGLHWDVPAFKETIDAKMDGSAAPMKGPTVPDGLTISFKKVSATKLTYEVKLKDKAMDEGEQVLSADGKTLTDTSWIAGKPTEKEIALYERQ